MAFFIYNQVLTGVDKESMNVNVEKKANSKATISITITSDEMTQHIETAFGKQAARITVPGFRQGKAPRAMIESRINPQLLQQDTVDVAIESSYRKALSDENLEPLEQGTIEDYKFNDDGSFTYSVSATLRPEITLPDYKGITVNAPKTEVTDLQVDSEIDRIVTGTTQFGEVTDSGIEVGDYVTINYTATVDGQVSDELSTNGYPLEVGNDTFFPELNEGLLGLKVGEEKTIEVKYDADKADEKLAGKDISYAIKIDQVRRMLKPEVTDEWVKEITNNELSSVEELRDRIKQNLSSMAVQSDKEHARNEILRAVVDGAEIEIPDLLADEELTHIIEDFDSRLLKSHMTLEEYAEQSNKTIDDIRTEQQIMARDMVRRSLVLQEIARREKLLVTNEDLNSMIDVLAAGNNMKPYKMKKELEKSGQINSLANRLFQEKIFSFLEENATIVSGNEEINNEEKPKKKKAAATNGEKEEKAKKKVATETDGEVKPKRTKKTAENSGEKQDLTAEEKPKRTRKTTKKTDTE